MQSIVITKKSLEQLKKKFRELKNNAKSNISLLDIENKVKRYYGKELKKCLFKANKDNQEGVSYSKISGLEISSMKDINNEPMTSVNKIEVYDE